MHSALVGQVPTLALEYFSAILGIPRESGKEDGMVGFLRAWAVDNGFPFTVDGLKNIVIKVPAVQGFEDAPAVAIQAHTDMVYTPNDPVLIQQPIEIELVDGWVQTKGQSRTLGADNSAGIVLAMDAALTAKVRGPLELIFTADEEGGMTGAEGFKRDEHGLLSRTLINLDTPEGGKIAVESAGFQYVEGVLPIVRKSKTVNGNQAYRLTLANLAGGHSGDHVGLNRGNAIHTLAEMMRLLPPRSLIVSFKSDGAGNAIPSQAEAVVIIPGSGWQQDLENVAEAARRSLNRPEIIFSVERCASDGQQPYTEGTTRQLLDLLSHLPDGVQQMSGVVAGLPALSTTLAVVVEKEGALSFKQIVRGSDESSLRGLAGDIKGIYESDGATATLTHHGPGWKQEPHSPLVQTARHAYLEIGVPAELKGYHCGLELAALIGDPDNPNFDSVLSFGCEVQNEHGVNERMHLQSMRNARWVLHQVLEYLASGKA